MITFDKLKIVVKSINYIGNINTNKFQTIINDNVVTEYQYQPIKPYLLILGSSKVIVPSKYSGLVCGGFTYPSWNEHNCFNSVISDVAFS